MQENEMPRVIKPRPTAPWPQPSSPIAPTAKEEIVERTLLESKTFSRVSNKKSVSLLKFLKSIPNDIPLENIYIEVSGQCTNYPSDIAEANISLVTIEKKKNSKYAATQKRYETRMKTYTNAKKLWDEQYKVYKKELQEWSKERDCIQLEKERTKLSVKWHP